MQAKKRKANLICVQNDRFSKPTAFLGLASLVLGLNSPVAECDQMNVNEG